jgi:hypothetical protein
MSFTCIAEDHNNRQHDADCDHASAARTGSSTDPQGWHKYCRTAVSIYRIHQSSLQLMQERGASTFSNAPNCPRSLIYRGQETAFIELRELYSKFVSSLNRNSILNTNAEGLLSRQHYLCQTRKADLSQALPRNPSCLLPIRIAPVQGRIVPYCHFFGRAEAVRR